MEAAMRWRNFSLAYLLVALLAPAFPCRADERPQVERYLPNDTDLVAYANVRQIVDSPLFKKYALERVRYWLKTDPRAQLMALVGMDPMRDIRSLVLTGPASFAILDRWLYVVDGRFDLPKIQTGAALTAKLSPDTLKIDVQNGVPVYELHNKKRPQPIFAALIDAHTLVVSSVKLWVTDAVLKSQGKKTTHLNDDVHALLAQQDFSESLWFTGIPYDLVTNQLVSLPRLRAIFSSVRSFSGKVRLDDKARADIRMETANARSAVQLRRYLEAAKVATELAIVANEKLRDDAPLLAGIVRTFEISQDDATVRMRTALSADEIDRWIEKEKARDERKDKKSPP
jgi:hypothetical protein